MNTGVFCGTVSHILLSFEQILFTVASDTPVACAVRFLACVRGKSGSRLAFSCMKYLFTLKTNSLAWLCSTARDGELALWPSILATKRWMTQSHTCVEATLPPPTPVRFWVGSRWQRQLTWYATFFHEVSSFLYIYNNYSYHLLSNAKIKRYLEHFMLIYPG